MAVVKGYVSNSCEEGGSLNYFRAIAVINQVAPKAFHQILTWGCKNKPQHMTLKEYLKVEKGFSNLTLKKYFNKSQVAKMEDDPSCLSFDVTLLYSCIQRACDNIAIEDQVWNSPSDTLEHHLYYIKNLRNSLVHSSDMTYSEDELNDFATNFKNKLFLAMTEAGHRFSIPKTQVNKLQSDYNEAIDNILGRFDLSQNSEQKLNKRLEMGKTVQTKGRKELHILLESTSNIDFSEVVSGHRQQIDVSLVFTNFDLEVTQESQWPVKSIGVERLLDIKKSPNVFPSIIIVEGAAGVGKTTLFKKIMSDWVKGTEPHQRLYQYDLVFHIDCGNQAVNDFKSLLQSQMPKVSHEMTSDELYHSVLDLRVLFLVDGFDELNRSSQKLLSEIFKLSTNHKMQTLVTTRPVKLEALYKMIPVGHEVCHTKINGMCPERGSEFISKLCKALQANGQLQKDAVELINFVATTPWLLNLLSLPLNIVLLTFLWAQSPERIKWLKTSTSLYFAIVNSWSDRLIDRLLVHEATCHLQKSDLTERLSRFLEVLYRESLSALRHDQMFLSKRSISLLDDTCVKLGFPVKEVFSTFLSVTGNWNQGKYSQEVRYPFKEFRDFYATLAILDFLKRSDIDAVMKSISKGFRQVLTVNKIPIGLTLTIIKNAKGLVKEKLDKNLTIDGILIDLHEDDPASFEIVKYRNVLIHLPGLLKMDGDKLDHYASELVQLLAKTNLSDTELWLDVLTETDCDDNVVAEVKEVIPRHLLCIREGHLKAACPILIDSEINSVDLNISSNPNKLPGLRRTLGIISKRDFLLKFCLHYQWRYPEHGCSDNLLKVLLGKSNSRVKLSHFMGSLTSLSSLPKSLESLYVALGKRYADNDNNAPDYICREMHNLEYLYIHTVGGLPIECLPVLPRKHFPVDLWFSNIDDSTVEWVGRALRKLASTVRPFWSIRFPRSKLTVEGCKNLANQLKNIIIGQEGVLVSSINISKRDVEVIREAFGVVTKSSFNISDEIKIWTFSPASH